MPASLSPSAQRVQDALRAKGIVAEVREFPDTTRTAAEAAHAIGCRVEQIAKSIVFRARETSRAIVVILSGPDRVDESRVAELVGEGVRKADAGFVREHVGYAIGGVPPLGHAGPTVTFVDEALTKMGELWAAAGTPFAVVKLTPDELVLASGAQIAPLRRVVTT